MFLTLKPPTVAFSSRILRQRLMSSVGTPPPTLPPPIERPKKSREKYEEEQRRLKEKLDRARPFSEIPGPREFPLIKSAWVFLPKIGTLDKTTVGGFYGRLYKEYGKIVRLSFPRQSLVLCFDPAYVLAMFRSDPDYPKRPGFDPLFKYRLSLPEEYTTAGLFFLQGEEWYKLRKTALRYFVGGHVNEYVQPIREVNADFISRIKIIRDRDNEVKDFIQELFKWALESLGYIALNRRLGCLDINLSPFSESQLLITSLHETFEASHKMESSLPFFRLFKTPNYRRLMKAQSYFHSVIMKYVKEGMEDIKISEATKSDSDSPKRGYLLDSFLKDEKLDKKTAAVLINDVFFAGIDTTSAATMFTLYHLARNPEKQDRLRENIMKTRGSPMAIVVNRYLQSCINEALRLNAVNVGTARVLLHDMELGGYRIPAGTIVAGILAQIGRMEEFFEKPTEYIPERFLVGQHESEGIQRPKLDGSHYPFGSGSRHCLGRNVAMFEMSLLITEIIANFRVEHHHAPVDTRLRIVNSPDRPIDLTFHDLKTKSSD